ncbi:hypothetical protein OAQ21_03455 [Flavobacteriales bacterium]|nr:hypothetical protein [Flavobacteriales bacterium]
MKSKEKITHILLIAFCIRFVLLLVDQYIITLPQGGRDAKAFEALAYSISTSNYDSGILYYISSGQNIFSLIGSFIYYVIGREPLILGLLNVFLGVYVVKLVFRSSFLLWRDYKIAAKAAWVAAIFPTLALHSALFLREVPINVFLLLSIISFIKYQQSYKKINLFWLIFYVIVASILHNGIIFIFLSFILVLIFQKNKNLKIKETFFSRLLAAIIIICTIFIINSSGIAMNKIGGSFDNSISVFELAEARESEGNTAFPSWLRISSVSNEFWKIPLRVVAFIYSPLIPFLVKSPYHMLGLVDSVLYLILFKRIFSHRKFIQRIPSAKAVLIMTLGLIFVFSLSVSNVGTAIRHRAKFAPLLIILFLPKKLKYNSIHYKI